MLEHLLNRFELFLLMNQKKKKIHGAQVETRNWTEIIMKRKNTFRINPGMNKSLHFLCKSRENLELKVP